MATKTVNRQLRPIKDRLSPEQQDKRAQKIVARATVADNLNNFARFINQQVGIIGRAHNRLRIWVLLFAAAQVFTDLALIYKVYYPR